ncbi:MAG: hypothetical protein KKC66_04650 [Candidatus Omnitrophica bacterium]|nr:hypothetical protein [Candidatus Omnitrophota bacterium]MBU1933169.1 hypothetical protein [Candidatus Omnitrophota bacterium]
MRKIICLFLFSLLACQISGFSEEIEINSTVFIANTDQDFFVIKAGEDDGVEIGDGLIVHRGGKKIAEAYIIEVRPDVSAAEILEAESGEEIRENDEILIVKRTEAYTAEEDAGVSHILSEAIIGGDTISLEIYNTKNSVFSYAGMILRENGFSVISSNRADGLILASKPIELSVLKELWADARAAIGHSLITSFEIKDEGRSSLLTASSFKEHFQKRKYVKQPVKRDSKYYNEIIDVASQIKERSER